MNSRARKEMFNLNRPTVDELIKCPKTIIKADRRSMVEKNRSYRNNIRLESEDGKYNFIMFMRQSSEFLEDFSVGLIWTNANEYWNTKKQLILIRCQGPHDSKQEFESDPHHSYHIHQLSSKDIEQKRFNKPSNRGITDSFSSFDEAIIYFCNRCAIIGLSDYIDLNNDQIEGQCSLF